MPLLLLVSLLGCGPGDLQIADDTGGTDDTAPGDDTGGAPDDSGDTHETDDTSPTDLDGDGADAAADCDDRDPDVFPGAAEAWNELDDDCDGVIDADGDWAGTLAIDASAIYEGHRYNFSLDCPFAGTRVDGTLDWTVVCVPDPDDADAQRMLGATLTLTPEDPDVTGDTWSDTVIVTSSNGWDTDGDGTIAWSTFESAAVSIEQSSLSLAFSGRGTIGRE